MQAGKQIDPADDYEAAAEYVARRFGRPIDAQLMVALTTAPRHVIEDIECNPQEWARRVREYARGLEDAK